MASNAKVTKAKRLRRLLKKLNNRRRKEARNVRRGEKDGVLYFK